MDETNSENLLKEQFAVINQRPYVLVTVYFFSPNPQYLMLHPHFLYVVIYTVPIYWLWGQKQIVLQDGNYIPRQSRESQRKFLYIIVTCKEQVIVLI